MRTLNYSDDKEHAKKEKIDLNEIPEEITLEYLSDQVRKMRHQQRRYYATGNKEVLSESRKLEAHVDAVLARLNDKQLNLF